MKMYTYSLAVVLSASISFSVQAMDDVAAPASPCQIRVELPEADSAHEAAVLAELILTVTRLVPGFGVAKCPEWVFLGAYILSILSDADLACDDLSILLGKLGYSPLAASRPSAWVRECSEDYFWSVVTPNDLQELNEALKDC